MSQEFSDYPPQRPDYDYTVYRKRRLRIRAKKESRIKLLGLSVDDIPDEVMAEINRESTRYWQSKIDAALRRIADELIAQKT